MHACADHQHAWLQASGNHRLISIRRGDLHNLRFHRHAGFVEHPDRAGLTVLPQGAGGQLDHWQALHAAESFGQHVYRRA